MFFFFFFFFFVFQTSWASYARDNNRGLLRRTIITGSHDRFDKAACAFISIGGGRGLLESLVTRCCVTTPLTTEMVRLRGGQFEPG